jgi:hypothetical protein
MFLGAVGSAPLPLNEIESILVGNGLGDENIKEIAGVAHKLAKPMDNTDFAPSWRGKMTEKYVIAAMREIAGLQHARMRPRHILKVV